MDGPGAMARRHDCVRDPCVARSGNSYSDGMTMKKNALDFWVGLFVVLGFVALLFLALKAGNMSSLSFQSTYSVKMKFDNIGGLKPRAAVKSAGVMVGRVQSIEFDTQTYQALVTIDVFKPYTFPKDSSAKILTSGLLGEQYIGLDPGGDEQLLKDGDTLTMTQSAIVLENLIGQFLYSKAADAGAGKPAVPATPATAAPAAPGPAVASPDASQTQVAPASATAN
jgi:phospholipid/cholesterol/gamma-HCH transport system substrate-binding protein